MQTMEETICGIAQFADIEIMMLSVAAAALITVPT